MKKSRLSKKKISTKNALRRGAITSIFAALLLVVAVQIRGAQPKQALLSFAPSSSLPYCGDGVSQPDRGEHCDDGNGYDNDGCTNACDLAHCGDGIEYYGIEQCDYGDGTNGTTGSDCSATCTVLACPDADSDTICDDADMCPNDPLNDFDGDGVCADADTCAGVANPGSEQTADFDGDGVVDACDNCTDTPNPGQEDASPFNGIGDACEGHCGNGLINEGEECDDGNNSPNDNCNATCGIEYCGDGIVQMGSRIEICDDGEANAPDGACNTSCLRTSCGDGIVQPARGEECDDLNNVNNDACTNACKRPACGDGVIQSPEACDNGASNNDLGFCTTACQIPRCGDGIVQSAILAEQCDLGGANSDTGACTSSCKNAVCGDGRVHVGIEQCDGGLGSSPGTARPTDTCSSACTLTSCGDGVRQSTEACDDGNASNDDACTTSCNVASCGDGFVQAGRGEECDEGAAINSDTDACTASCKIARCGDSKVQAGVEACDDGNTSDADKCTSACELTYCGDSRIQRPNGAANDGDIGADGQRGWEGCDSGRVSSCLCSASCQRLSGYLRDPFGRYYPDPACAAEGIILPPVSSSAAGSTGGDGGAIGGTTGTPVPAEFMSPVGTSGGDPVPPTPVAPAFNFQEWLEEMMSSLGATEETDLETTVFELAPADGMSSATSAPSALFPASTPTSTPPARNEQSSSARRIFWSNEGAAPSSAESMQGAPSFPPIYEDDEGNVRQGGNVTNEEAARNENVQDDLSWLERLLPWNWGRDNDDDCIWIDALFGIC